MILKKLYLFIFTVFLLLIYSCTSQTNVYCSLKVKKNIFYHGISNPIFINCTKIDYNSIELISNKGKLTRVRDNGYMFTISSEKERLPIILKIKNTDQETIIEKVIHAVELPQPIIYIGEAKLPGKIKKKHLDAQLGLYARLDTSVTNYHKMSYNISIDSFEISIELNDKTINLKSSNAFFNNEQKTNIEKLHSGDSFKIQNIELTNLDGKKKIIKSVNVEIE